MSGKPLLRLLDMVVEALGEARVPKAAVTGYFAQAAATAQWPLPPLFTDLSFRGEPMQGFVEVKLGCAIEDYASVYETYINAFITGKLSHTLRPAAWLTKYLGVSALDARALLARPGAGGPRWGMRDNLLALVQLAALAAWNFPCKVFRSPHTFVVSCGNYNFGIDNGAPVSNMGEISGPDLLLPAHATDLSELRREGMSLSRSKTIIGAIWQWSGTPDAQRVPELESLRLALTLLYWRLTPGRHNELRSGLSGALSSDAWGSALQLASSAVQQDNPYARLREIFVPNLMSLRAFRKEFGDTPLRGKPNATRRALIANRLTALQQNYGKESTT